MGRYDIISPSEIFRNEGVRERVSPSNVLQVEAYHDDVCDGSDEGITEEKTDGTCIQLFQGHATGVEGVSRTSIPQGIGSTEEQTL